MTRITKSCSRQKRDLCSCSTALVYGLVCLAMAYLASLMGSVLQVATQPAGPQASSANLMLLARARPA